MFQFTMMWLNTDYRNMAKEFVLHTVLRRPARVGLVPVIQPVKNVPMHLESSVLKAQLTAATHSTTATVSVAPHSVAYSPSIVWTVYYYKLWYRCSGRTFSSKLSVILIFDLLCVFNDNFTVLFDLFLTVSHLFSFNCFVMEADSRQC